MVGPIQVLLEIRDGPVRTMQELARALGIRDPSGVGTLANRFKGVLADLQLAGLIDITWQPQDARIQLKNPELAVYLQSAWSASVTLSPRWELVQSALDISLTELAAYDGDSVIARPYFGRPRPPSGDDHSDLFVLMPFADSLRPVYDDHIQAVAERLGCSIRRADDFFTANGVMEDIWSAISSSRVIIADCTGRNPNVFYEIGIAHTLGRPVVLLTQDADDVPFDVRHLRFIEYEVTPQGMMDFEVSLGRTIAPMLSVEP